MPTNPDTDNIWAQTQGSDPPMDDVGIGICRYRTIPMSQIFLHEMWLTPIHRNTSGRSPQPCHAPSSWDNYQKDPSEQKNQVSPWELCDQGLFPSTVFLSSKQLSLGLMPSPLSFFLSRIKNSTLILFQTWAHVYLLYPFSPTPSNDCPNALVNLFIYLTVFSLP